MLGRLTRWRFARWARSSSTRLVVSVEGHSLAADRLRASLTVHPGYLVAASAKLSHVHLVVDETAQYGCLACDAIVSDLAIGVLFAIEQLTPDGRFLVIGSSGENNSDRVLHFYVPPTDVYRVALADGITHGLDLYRQYLTRRRWR